MAKFGKKGSSAHNSSLANGTASIISTGLDSTDRSNSGGNDTFNQLWDDESSSSSSISEKQSSEKVDAKEKTVNNPSTNSSSSGSGQQNYSGPIDVDEMTPWKEEEPASSQNVATTAEAATEGKTSKGKHHFLPKKVGSSLRKPFLGHKKENTEPKSKNDIGSGRSESISEHDIIHESNNTRTNNTKEMAAGRRSKSIGDDHSNSSREGKPPARSRPPSRPRRRKKKGNEEDFYQMPSLLAKSDPSIGESSEEEPTNDDLFKSLAEVENNNDVTAPWMKKDVVGEKKIIDYISGGEEKNKRGGSRDGSRSERDEKNRAGTGWRSPVPDTSLPATKNEEAGEHMSPRQSNQDNANRGKPKKGPSPDPFPILEITTEGCSDEEVSALYPCTPAKELPPPSREKKSIMDQKYDDIHQLRIENLKLKQQIHVMRGKQHGIGGTDSNSTPSDEAGRNEALKALGETAVKQRKIIKEQEKKIAKLNRELKNSKSSDKSHEEQSSRQSSEPRKKGKYVLSDLELERIQNRSEHKTLTAEVDGLQRELNRALETIEEMDSTYQTDRAKIVSLNETLASERSEIERLMQEDLLKNEQIERFDDELLAKNEEIERLREEVALKHEVLIDIEKDKERERKTSDIRTGAMGRELEELRDEVEALKEENETLLAAQVAKPKEGAAPSMFALDAVEEGDEEEDDESVVSKLTVENKALKEKNSWLETSMSSNITQGEEWKNQSDELQVENDRLLEENENLRKRIEDDKEAAAKEIAIAEEAMNKERLMAADLGRKHDKMLIENKSLQRSNRELEEAISSAAESKESEIMTVMAEKQELEEQNKKLRSSVSAAETLGAAAADEHAASARELELQLEALTGEKEQLLDENEKLRNDIDEVKEKAKVEVAALNEAAEEEKSNASDLNRKLNVLTLENQRLHEKNRELESAVSTATNQEKALSAEHAVARREWEHESKRLLAENERLLDENKSLREENEAAKAELASTGIVAATSLAAAGLSSRGGESEEANAELKRKLEEMTKEKEKLEEENHTLQSTLSSAAEPKGPKAVEMAAVDKAAHPLGQNKEVEKLKSHNAKLSLRVQDLEAENRRLEGLVAASAASIPGQATSEKPQFDQAALLSAAKQQEDASSKARPSWRRQWTSRSFIAGNSTPDPSNMTDEELNKRELELKVENLEDKVRSDKATIQKLRSDLVKVNSTYKEESYITKKRIENLVHENTAYAIKVKVLEKEFNELNTTKTEGGEMRDFSDRKEDDDIKKKSAEAAGQAWVSTPGEMNRVKDLEDKCASLEKQIEALEKERDVLMSQVESNRKNVEELEQKIEGKVWIDADNTKKGENESEEEQIARLEKSCATYEQTVASLKSDLTHHRMTSKAESYRNELELEKAKEENRVILIKLARLDKELSNDPAFASSLNEDSRENRGKSIVQLDAGYVNELRTNLALSKTAIVTLEEQLHESQMQEKSLQEEIDRLNSERDQLASSIDEQLANVKDERRALDEELEAKSRPSDKTEEALDPPIQQIKEGNSDKSGTEQKSTRQDADLAPDHPWRRRSPSTDLDNYSPSASEVELALSFEEEDDEEPPPQDVPYTFSSSKFGESMSSLAFRQRKGEINNLEDKIFQIAMEKR